jgi:hypothetical protein
MKLRLLAARFEAAADMTPVRDTTTGMYVCMPYVCMYVCMYVDVCMYVCM